MPFPTSFLLVGSGLSRNYVEVFENYSDEHNDSDEERSDGNGTNMVEEAAYASKDWSFRVSWLEVPDGCSRTNPEWLKSREKVDDPA